MSLKDMILEIAGEMEKEARLYPQADPHFAPETVEEWAMQLRLAVEESEKRKEKPIKKESQS